MEAMDDLEFEWPEDNKMSSYYIPNRVETAEPPAPKPVPKLIRKTQPQGTTASSRVNNITDYAWKDEASHIKVFVALPGVRKEGVTVDFYDDRVDLVASGLPTGTHKLALRKLFDQINGSKCFFKVQESKDRVVLVLAKPDKEPYEDVKEWPQLHFGTSTEGCELEPWKGGRMTRQMQNAPPLPKMPEPAKRKGM
mmetsp:Transcript_17025/g.28454  ORF Transcript_17025/g.28454 Transcript_17025/m.28454 type:complete len:195 (+) Transcript_17025:72-656(+)|eukprot:CAMPEP_0119312182 /NCGR_PEP_ID=MMETSP1333-20130426/25399_1 /TAXON_ID=418940 /ORGANISM="Scyphosphaera apsteinii, Strain RCC1455" /LENGTH=194 /DNA_ID=CAMNT_0007316763 /DNA_START=66 /DNA_END=650 /DNA_ORIENTATION=+